MVRDPEYLAFARLVSAAISADEAGPPSVAEERARLAESARRLPGTPMADVRDVTAGGVPARLYRPRDGYTGAGLVYFHGGGFYLGDLGSWDPVCRTVAAATGCAILSIGYRLAPEDPFPAGVQDAYAATRWAAAHTGDLGIDRIGVGGDSAGANLAAVTAQRAYDDGLPLAVQLLVYGVYDLSRERVPVADPDGLTMAAGPADWAQVRDRYLAGADAAHPWASPGLRTDLRGLAPAVLGYAEYDPLREQGEEYARRLRSAGVPVSEVAGTGLDHAYLAWAGYAASVRAAIADIGAAVRAVLAPGR